MLAPPLRTMNERPAQSSAPQPISMKLADLLGKWSLLEPDRCQYTSDPDFDEPWYTIFFQNGKAHIEFKRATQEDHALLQAAIQKTVESKGWLWSILYSSKGVYRAGVKIAERYISETAHYPAYALLAAYLKAIQMAQSSADDSNP
ncbi:MAG: hypothetical protein AB8G77_08150 [Rhodothermales bacterium]